MLVQGAAGAVGQALLVLGRMAGLELWGTTRGKHAALIRELGATRIDYQPITPPDPLAQNAIVNLGETAAADAG